MKNLLLTSSLATLALAAPALHAQEVARVLSSVPVIHQVAVPRQVCNTQNVVVEAPKSGAGALMGAVAGGAAGNAIGDGTGRAVATMLGLVGGAVLGNHIEGPNNQVQAQTQCTTQTVYENRAVGYNVTYEYGGKQYQVQMPQDPGPTIRVQVVPLAPGAQPTYTPPSLPAPPGMAPAPISGIVGPTVITSSTTYLPQVVAVPVYVAPVYAAPGYYYPRPYPYPAVRASFGYVRHSHRYY